MTQPVLLREYEDHYNTVRPHQGIGNRMIGAVSLPAAGPPSPGETSRLGGLVRTASELLAGGGVRAGLSRAAASVTLRNIKGTMDWSVDITVTEHRVVRNPACGVIDAIREYEGIEIAHFVEPGAAWGKWRIVIPENPIPCAFVDLVYGRTGRRLRCLPRSWPADPENGRETPVHASALGTAKVDLYKRGREDLDAGRHPESVAVLAQWVDGTRVEMCHVPLWRLVTYAGSRFWSPLRELSEDLHLKMREEAGLGPTPSRLLEDGRVSPKLARSRYRREIAANAELRERALHVLGRCEY